MKKKLLVFIAAVALILLSAGSVALAGTFSDIDDNETEAAVETLYSLGIVDGYDDGYYYPDLLLTRAQFCKMVVLAMGREDDVTAYSHLTLFSDVPSANWEAGYVNLATSLGIINGYGNGAFGPSDPINYGQAVTILLRVLGYTTADIGYYWPGDYVAIAEKIGLDCGLDLTASNFVSRGDAALLVLQMLNSDDSQGDAYSSATYAGSVKNAIILDTDAVSDEGYDDCLMVYIPGSTTTTTTSSGTASSSSSGRIAYYEQEEELDDDFVGCQGTLLLDGDDAVVSFIAGNKTYDIEYGVLLDNNSGSAGGTSRKASFYIDGDVEEYPQISTLSSSLVGCYGLLLLNENGYVYAFEGFDDDGYSLVSDVLLLSSSRSEAAVYDGGDIDYYDASSRFSSSVGSWGALLLDEDGEAAGFLEEDYDSDSVEISGANAVCLYTDSGDLDMEDSVTVIYPAADEGWALSDWAGSYEAINSAGVISGTVYYASSGDVELLLLDETHQTFIR